MNRQYWANWLEQAIVDNRLDDNERRELQDALSKEECSAEDLSYLRNLSFKLVQQHVEAGDVSCVRWLERIVKVLDGVRNDSQATIADSWFSPGEDCRRGIIGQLKLARRCVDICVFTISDDQISDEILAAHKRGVTVRIISDNEKMYDKGSDIERLAERGIEIKIDTTSHHMHHKFAIFDGCRLINGSFNWTRSASKYNQEDITLTDNMKFIARYQQKFEQLWLRFNSL